MADSIYLRINSLSPSWRGRSGFSRPGKVWLRETITRCNHSNLPGSMWSLLVGCTFTALVTGFQLTSSYLISPVERECQAWSSSITVVGGALLWAAAAASGIIVVPRLSQRHPQGTKTWLTASVVTCGAGFGLCGVAVAVCDWSTWFSQTVYALGYICIGFGSFIPNPLVSVILIGWLPQNQGFSSGYASFCLGLGSLGISELMLYCQTLIKKDRLHVTTVFFGLGIVMVFLLVIGMVTTVYPPCIVKDDRSHNLISTNSTKMSRLEIIRTRQFAVIFFARVVGPFCGFGLTARQQDFLDAIWGTSDSPVAILGAAVFGSYIGGRLFWLIMAEKLNNCWCWSASLSVQVIAIGMLPWFVYYSSSSWTKYAALVDFCIITATFPGTKLTALGTCLEVFGSVNMTTAYGMTIVAIGLAGFLGPLAFKACKNYWSNYTPVLYVSAGASFLSLIACLFLLTPIDRRA